MKSILLIRADANAEIGAGHVMRTLGLAQAWQRDGGQALYASAAMPPPLADRLASEGVHLEKFECQIGSAEDLGATIAIASTTRANCVVADGYAFDALWQTGVKRAGLPLAVIDDYGHAARYCADVVLNQNLAADAALYSQREPETQLLLGSNYALLRNEFVAFRNRSIEVPPRARRILVTFGGSDPENLTNEVVRALTAVSGDDLEVRVVVGGSYRYLSELEEALASMPYSQELLVNVRDMPGLMAWADVAVSAAGSTVWELAFMKVPMILIVAAENQREIGRRLADAEAAISLGARETLTSAAIAGAVASLLPDQERRTRLASNAGNICDGYGAERVLAVLRNACR